MARRDGLGEAAEAGRARRLERCGEVNQAGGELSEGWRGVGLGVRAEDFYGSPRFKSRPAQCGAPYYSGLMAEFVPRAGVEPHERVINGRVLLVCLLREYEIAGGTK